MFCQTSTQEFPQTEPIDSSVKKGNTRIMHVGDTILAAAVEAKIDKIGALYTTIRHATHSSTKNIYQISEMLPMDNIYVSIVTQEWQKPTKLVTAPDIPILYDIIPRGYLTSCTSDWYRKITLWPTTSKIKMSFSSTAHSVQHLRWPRLVCFTMIWGTS